MIVFFVFLEAATAASKDSIFGISGGRDDIIFGMFGGRDSGFQG